MSTDSLIDDLIQGNAVPAGMVPKNIGHMKRFPFLLLIDISASTGEGGANADIHEINALTSQFCDLLRAPPASSDLADQTEQIDVSIVTYSDSPTVEIDWSLAQNLPVSFNFTPQRSTVTGRALEFSLTHIGQRLAYYKNGKIPFGMPHIFHITDGAPTDVSPGTPDWEILKARLAAVDGSLNPEKSYANILHFVSSAGCRMSSQSPTLSDGSKVTGQQMLSMLSGEKTVFELVKGPDLVPTLVKLITVTITSITKFDKSATEAIHDALTDISGAVKTTPTHTVY